MSDTYNTSLSAVLLCLAYITLVSSTLPQDQTSSSSQWDGPCGSVDGLTCGNEVTLYCEKETGICMTCTHTVCKIGGFDDEKCERRCPEWYAQNIPKPTAPPVSKQWQGNCGQVEGLTCGEDVNYYCEIETDNCVPCMDTFCSKEQFNDQQCAEICPEWYSQNKKAKTTLPSSTRDTTSPIYDSTIAITPENRPNHELQTNDTIFTAIPTPFTENTANVNNNKTNWLLYVAYIIVGVLVIIILMILLRKIIKRMRGRERRFPFSGHYLKVVNLTQSQQVTKANNVNDLELGQTGHADQSTRATVIRQETEHSETTPEHQLLPKAKNTDNCVPVSQQPPPSAQMMSSSTDAHACDKQLTTNATARATRDGDEQDKLDLPLPVPEEGTP